MTQHHDDNPRTPWRRSVDAETDSAALVGELGTLEVDEADNRQVWPIAIVFEWLGALVLIVLTLAVTAGVIARVAGGGITGIIELAGASMVVMVALGTSAVAMRDGHVRLELIDPLLSDRSLKGVNIFSLIFQIVVGIILTLAIAMIFVTDVQRGTTIPGELGIPRMVISGIVAVSFLTLVLSLVRRLFLDLNRRHSSVLTKDSAVVAQGKADLADTMQEGGAS